MLRPFVLAVGIAVAGLAAGVPGRAQDVNDPGAMACSLVISYLGLDPPYFQVFQAWLLGYVAASPKPATGDRDAGALNASLDYCRAHPTDAFAKAAAAAVNK